MLFMSAQTLIDGVLVGRGVGADGIAAVNIVAPPMDGGVRIGTDVRHRSIGGGQHAPRRRQP